MMPYIVSAFNPIWIEAIIIRMLFYGVFHEYHVLDIFFSELFLSDPWSHPPVSPMSISSPEFYEAIYRSSVNASKNLRPVESKVTGPRLRA